MANIAKLPDGYAILANPSLTGRYGPEDRNLMAATSAGPSVVLVENGATVLATVSQTSFDVSFESLDALTVPYVNRFLAGTGSVVIKDWRTGKYRTKVRGTKSRKARFATATPVALPPVQQPAAVITVSAESRHKLAASPAVEVPTKSALKGAGRGYTDVGGIIIETVGFETLADAWRIANDGTPDPAAVLLTGPAGTAKTQLVRAFAGHLGVPYLKVDAGAIRTADDWSGSLSQDPATKTWAHRWSPFAQVLRAGEPCIVHIDELTRTDTPAALNALMGLLDETGTLLVPDANTVLRMPKGILVVATANIGPEFVGTLPLDGAIRQRFPYGIRMAPPTESNEAKLLVRRMGVTDDVALRLVRMANGQRKDRDNAQMYPSGAVISTRVLLSIAKRIGTGADPRSAVISTLHAQFDPGDDAALSVVIDSQFPKTYRPGAEAPGQVSEAVIFAEKHYFVAGLGVGNIACQWTYSDGNKCGHVANSVAHIK